MKPKKLDEDQQKAVEHFEGPALVVAGPGSGKTTVIKERILNLIQKHDVDPEHILAIAFTNAAADEMEKRFLREPTLKDGKPKICTLHVFGKDIITEHYELAGFTQDPAIWDADDIEQIINKEKTRLNIENEERYVYIYKFEGNRSGRCYIGQTINLKRREREHRTYSSNRGLREALANGDEYFNCKEIKRVKGIDADKEEEWQINFYKNRSVVNLALGMEHIGTKYPEIPTTIYKIKLPTVVTCWIGMSTDTDPEGIRNKAFRRAIEDKGTKAHPEYIKEALRKAIENEVIKSAAFEIIATVPGANATRRIKQEIDKHKNWAVFNREAPLRARESNKRRIEIFCQHFDISYDEVLEHTPRFKDLMAKFDRLKEDIENEKRQVITGVFDPNKIVDLIFRAFARRYESVKQEANAIDFLDMLIHSANLLENNQGLLQDYQEKYRYVFVDEFQDISPVDFRLIDLFSENLFAVGDDDQAIYGFRGGDSSIMREKFGKRKNVTHYKITRNYRSTSTIVRHAKSLIEHNPERIPKNLRAKNSAQNQVQIFETPQKTATVKEVLLRELSNLLTTNLKKVGILARNWKGEINDIQDILDFSELQIQGFEIHREELGDPSEKNRRKIILRRGTKNIEILNIHTAKGREWEKVILLVNTMYNSLPDDRNDLAEERRLFYVAVTRAERELVVLDGGNCQFISEFQNAPPTKEELEEIFKAELAAREPKLKKELEEASKAALVALESRLKKELEEASKTARKQHEPDISRLRRIVAEARNAKQNVQDQIIDKLPQHLKTLNNTLLEELIPVLDTFESQFNNLQTTVESNEVSDNFVEFTKSARLAQEQLLDSLKNHGLKPIGTSSGALFNPVHHEELCPETYSNGVPAGTIARQEQRGYLLHDQIVRKVHVVISKRKQRTDALLCHDFTQPVRFVTYVGFRDLKNIETFKDGVRGHDSQGKVVQLQNLNVLFAFPKEDMTSLKSHIKKRPDIVNQNLQPIELISERFYIANDILKLLLIKPDVMGSDNQDPTIELVTRSGHVLRGHLRNFDEEFLYVDINKKDVIVYRAGILGFKNLIWIEITKAYKSDTPIEGHIVEQSKNGLRVQYKSLTGFLPASQVELSATQHLDSYIGKTYQMMVIKINAANNHFVFSRKAWLLKEQNTKFLKALSEVSEEPPKLRNIKRTSKTVEAIPGTNVSSLILKDQSIPLGKSISVIVPEFVEEVIDTPLSISTDFTESLDTYVTDRKPAIPKTIEVQRDRLYKPVDLIVPEPVKKAVDYRLPTPKDFLDIPNSQVQNLTSETPRIEVIPNPPEKVNNRAQLTLQECQDILKKQIQEIKPDTSKPENPDNVTQEPKLETGVDRETSVESNTLTRSDSSTEINNDAHKIKGQNFSENAVEDMKKSLRDYLRRGADFAVEKIRSTIFKKPNP